MEMSSAMMFNETNEMSELNFTFNYTPAAMNFKFDNPFNKMHIRVTFCILYTLVFLCCFFGNLIVLLVIILNPRMRTRTNFFLANLAAADFCVGVFCIFPNLSLYISPIWHLGRVMCKIYYFAHYMSLTIPVVLLSVISVERYVAILYPLKAKQLFTFRRLRITQVLIWLALAAYNSPQLIDHDTFTIGEKTFCYIRSDNINTNAYVLANLIVWYILPLFILSFMYCKIATTLWQSSSASNFALNPQINQQVNYQPQKVPHQHHHILHSQNMPGANCSNAPNEICAAAVYASCSAISRRAECIEMSNMNSSVCTTKKRRLCHCNSNVSQVETELEYMSEITDGESNSDTYTNNTESSVRICARPVDEKFNQDFPADNSKKYTRCCLTKEGRRSQLKLDSICRSNNARFITTEVRGNYHKKRPSMNTQKVVQSRKKVIRLLLMIIGTFAVLALPYHIRTVIYLWFDTKHLASLFSPICYLLYYTNSGLNPILYAFLSGNFRKSLRDSFKCFSRK